MSTLCGNSDSDADKMENVQNVCKEVDNTVLSRFHLSADRGDTEAVRRLLGKLSSVDVVDPEHNALLHYASLRGRVDVVKLLLCRNANVNIRNAFGQTSLHLAAEIGHLEIAKLLLASNADVHVTDQSNLTPIDLAAKHGHCELVQLLTSSKKCLTRAYPLHLAAQCGSTKEVQQRLTDYENPDVADLNGDTPLQLASKNGHLKVVEALLKSNADSNIHDVSGKTPLHIASELGYVEMVKAMLEHRAEVNAVDSNGNTALHLAAANGHCSVVNVLLNQKAEVDARMCSQPSNGLEISDLQEKNITDISNTSLQIEPEDGNDEIANTQLINSSNVNAVFRRLATSNHSAVRNGNDEIIEHSILNAANVNTCNNAKMSSLHLACLNGHTSVAEILMDNHATVDVMKKAEDSPLYLAAKNGHLGVAELLMRRGICDFVEIFYVHRTPLDIAIDNRHTEVAEAILNHSRTIYEKLTESGETRPENAKRGVMQIEILSRDGRHVSAEIVWTENVKPLETRRDRLENASLIHASLSMDQRMVNLLLGMNKGIYSDWDIQCNFNSIAGNIESANFTSGARRDAREYRTNLRKVAQFLFDSSRFNVNHQERQLNTFLHRLIQLYEPSSNVTVLTSGSRDQSFKNQLIKDMLNLLLEKGANFNMMNSLGETPLITAAKKGCCNAIRSLFDWEAVSGTKLDLDARDQFGATALIKAAERNHVSVVRMLLNHKASVNLFDHYGFTALHAAMYDPDRNWFDLDFIRQVSRKRKFNREEYIQFDDNNYNVFRKRLMDESVQIDWPELIIDHRKEVTRVKEEIVKLLLANDETNVNGIDFGGNTPLDLAVKSSKQITSKTFKTLKNRGAIRNRQLPENETSIEEGKIDERGRNPLHRLIISLISYDKHYYVNFSIASWECYNKIFDIMVRGILLRPDDFKESAIASDDKGRTPLHYAILPLSQSDSYRDLVIALLKIGANVNATDMYGKTPLHYAEGNDIYELFVQCGADEDAKDEDGHTPRELRELRQSVVISEKSAVKSTFGQQGLYISKPIDISAELDTCRITELTKQKYVETIRIHSQSPRPQESAEEAIWKIWTKNDFVRINRRLDKLEPLVNRFIDRLAAGLKELDGRFECQTILVGSSREETRVSISGDFDYNFRLMKFSNLCDAFPHPLGLKGYFQLRRKYSQETKGAFNPMFDCFFNSDQCLLTSEVNSKFQITLEEVLHDHNFWQIEHLFEIHLEDDNASKFVKPVGLVKTLKLRMIRPIEDGEGGFLFVKISVDIVGCIHVDDWLSEGPSPASLSSMSNTVGCTLVFDVPRFDPSRRGVERFLFSDTFARVSFAPIESPVIQKSSPVAKAAYMVGKLILYDKGKATYQLKTCLLFCMAALNTRNGSEPRNGDEFTPKQLAFWVERIIFCFMEFSRHNVFPCYFMPTFKQPVPGICRLGDIAKDADAKLLDSSFIYSWIFHVYLDLCPDDSSFDIPIYPPDFVEQDLNADPDLKWELFDREEFIRALSSRRFD